MFKNLVEEYNTLENQANELIAKVDAEKRTFSDDEKVNLEKFTNRIAEIKTTIESAKKFASNKLDAGDIVLPTIEGKKDAVKDPKKFDRSMFAKAVDTFMAGGDPKQLFASTSLTTTNAAIYVPTEVAPSFVPQQVHCLLRGLAYYNQLPPTVSSTTTLKLPIPSPAAGGKVAQDADAATNGAPGLTDSVTLTFATYQSGNVGVSDVLNGMSDDWFANNMDSLGRSLMLGIEADDITTIKTATPTITLAANSGITAAEVTSMLTKLVARWRYNQFIIASSALYSAILNLVDNNKIVTFQNGQLFVGNAPVYACDSGLGGFTAGQTIGAVVSADALKYRDVTSLRLVKMLDKDQPGQTIGNLLVEHAFGYAATGVALVKTP